MRRNYLTEELNKECLGRLENSGTHLNLSNFITPKQDFIARRARLLGLREFIQARRTRIYSIDCSKCDFTTPGRRPVVPPPGYAPDESLFSVFARVEERREWEEVERRRQELEYPLIQHLFACVHAIPQLQHLTFKNNDLDDSRDMVDLIDIVSQRQRNLQSITLHGFSATHEEVVTRLQTFVDTQNDLERIAVDHEDLNQYLNQRLNHKIQVLEEALLTPERLKEQAFQAIQNHNAPWLQLLIHADNQNRLSNYEKALKFECAMEAAILNQQRLYLTEQCTYLESIRNSLVFNSEGLPPFEQIQNELQPSLEDYQAKLHKKVQPIIKDYHMEQFFQQGIARLQEAYLENLPSLSGRNWNENGLSTFIQKLQEEIHKRELEIAENEKKYTALSQRYETLNKFSENIEMHWQKALEQNLIPRAYQQGGRLFRQRLMSQAHLSREIHNLDQLLLAAYQSAEAQDPLIDESSRDTISLVPLNTENQDPCACLSILLDQPGVDPFVMIEVGEGKDKRQTSVFREILEEQGPSARSQRIMDHLITLPDLGAALTADGKPLLEDMIQGLSAYQKILALRNTYSPIQRLIRGYTFHFLERKEEFQTHVQSLCAANQDLDQVDQQLATMGDVADKAKRGLLGRSQLNNSIKESAPKLKKALGTAQSSLDQYKRWQKEGKRYMGFEAADPTTTDSKSTLAALSPAAQMLLNPEAIRLTRQERLEQEMQEQRARADQATKKKNKLEEGLERVLALSQQGDIDGANALLVRLVALKRQEEEEQASTSQAAGIERPQNRRRDQDPDPDAGMSGPVRPTIDASHEATVVTATNPLQQEPTPTHQNGRTANSLQQASIGNTENRHTQAKIKIKPNSNTSSKKDSRLPKLLYQICKFEAENAIFLHKKTLPVSQLGSGITEMLNEDQPSHEDYLTLAAGQSEDAEPSEFLIAATHTMEKEKHRIDNLMVVSPESKSLVKPKAIPLQVYQGFSDYYPDEKLNIQHHVLYLQKNIDAATQLYQIAKWIIKNRGLFLCSLPPSLRIHRLFNDDWAAFKSKCRRVMKETLLLEATLMEEQQLLLEDPETYIRDKGIERREQLKRLLQRNPLEFMDPIHKRALKEIEEEGEGQIHRIGVSAEENQKSLVWLKEIRALKLKEAAQIMEREEAEKEALEEASRAAQEKSGEDLLHSLYFVASTLVPASNVIYDKRKAAEYAKQAAHEAYMAEHQGPRKSTVSYAALLSTVSVVGSTLFATSGKNLNKEDILLSSPITQGENPNSCPCKEIEAPRPVSPQMSSKKGFTFDPINEPEDFGIELLLRIQTLPDPPEEAPSIQCAEREALLATAKPAICR